MIHDAIPTGIQPLTCNLLDYDARPIRTCEKPAVAVYNPKEPHLPRRLICAGHVERLKAGKL